MSLDTRQGKGGWGEGGYRLTLHLSALRGKTFIKPA